MRKLFYSAKLNHTIEDFSNSYFCPKDYEEYSIDETHQRYTITDDHKLVILDNPPRPVVAVNPVSMPQQKSIEAVLNKMTEERLKEKQS